MPRIRYLHNIDKLEIPLPKGEGEERTAYRGQPF